MISEDFQVYNFDDSGNWPKDQIGIYCISGCYNGKVIVGQTYSNGGFCQRWRLHRSELMRNKHNNSYLQHSFNKHRESDSFKFVVLEKSENNSDFIDEREKYWINHFDSDNHNFGWNIKSGGERGCRHSKETIEKMSKSHQKRAPISEETRLKMSLAGKERVRKYGPITPKGTKHTKEHIEKNRLSHLGKKLPESQIDKKRKWYKFTSPVGEYVNVFGLCRFCRENNLSDTHMARVHLGYENQHKGWRKFIE